MKGYVTQRRGRFYAVIYEGLDPVTGRERRSWHPAGTDRGEAERMAARLAAEREGRDDEIRSLSFGAYLTTQWLPAKKIELAASTYRDYERKTTNHVLPAVGRVGLRRLRPEHLDRLYKAKLRPTDGQRPLAPKTVYEIHLIIRGALGDAVRRGLIQRNVALFARSPLQRSFHQTEKTAWTAGQLRSFLHAAAGHKLFPALWLSANTGMRRSELLDSDGPTSTSPRLGCRSTAVSSPSATSSTRLLARPATPAAPSTSTPQRSRCSTDGEHSRPPPTRPPGPTTPASCSPTPPANPSTPTPCRRPSIGSCDEPTSRSSASTSCATPTAPVSRPASP